MKPSSIQNSPAGQPNGLRAGDWQFKSLFTEPRCEMLVAACWYEYARESEHVRRTMRQWLLHEKLTARFQPEMERICRRNARRKEPMPGNGSGAASQPVRAGRSRRPPDEIPVPKSDHQFWPEFSMPDYALARHHKLPERLWPLAKAWLATYDTNGEVDAVERRAGRRLRDLAEYLVRDTPWLRIPEAKREQAIKPRSNERSA